MALLWSSQLFAADPVPLADCRRDETPECPQKQEARCQREIENWLDKLTRSGQTQSGKEAAPQRALDNVRERIAINQRKQVPACQTLYEINGGRDPCKYSDTVECQVEKQRRCRTAVDAFLEQSVQMDREVSPQDVARGSLVAKFTERVRVQRKAGVSACQTWSDLMKMAATQ